MKEKEKKQAAGSYHPSVRILALVLSILVAGGTVTYLVMLLINLLG